MSTVEQIEAAIRALPAPERDRLAKDLPEAFPGIGRRRRVGTNPP